MLPFYLYVYPPLNAAFLPVRLATHNLATHKCYLPTCMSAHPLMLNSYLYTWPPINATFLFVCLPKHSYLYTSRMPLILVRIWATNNNSPHSSVLGHPFQLTPGVSHLCGVNL
ncbi:hypothetical protein BsWGS_10381 [Bradybaena similaris]